MRRQQAPSTSPSAAPKRLTRAFDQGTLSTRAPLPRHKNAPRKKRSASAPPKGSEASPLKKAAIEAITCPITRQLVVDPVVAEDENTYESAAIRQWLQSNYRSPMTNERMGDRTPNRHARLMVEAAVKEGAVPSEDAAQWHISSAKLLASGDVPGGMSSAIEHLGRRPRPLKLIYC